MTGPELRKRREAAGMSRAQVAAALGLSERQIYRYEDGETEILPMTERALSTVLPGLNGKVVAKQAGWSARKSKT